MQWFHWQPSTKWRRFKARMWTLSYSFSDLVRSYFILHTLSFTGRNLWCSQHHFFGGGYLKSYFHSANGTKVSIAVFTSKIHCSLSNKIRCSAWIALIVLLVYVVGPDAARLFDFITLFYPYYFYFCDFNRPLTVLEWSKAVEGNRQTGFLRCCAVMCFSEKGVINIWNKFFIFGNGINASGNETEGSFIGRNIKYIFSNNVYSKKIKLETSFQILVSRAKMLKQKEVGTNCLEVELQI